ncbi:hypothetical protein CTAYLR_003511 [Chrysophaeum taylorii]|uniref:tRNA-intron lyase n=1 Tax=Chrysophaeum taylorii TaxID=2483200 RepID=A0AAD7XL43_9STRA|nr:hypothetical protein CTAYLR_003511 [Chrysophaeum taylorii]
MKAELLGGECCVVRGREAISTLHDGRECFGTVKLGERGVDDASVFGEAFPEGSPAREYRVELRLMVEEEIYLATRNRIEVLGLDREAHWASALRRVENFDSKYQVYDHMRSKGYVVKNGIQFGVEYLLYRGSPDDFHAEYCCLVKIGDLSWKRVKTIARLAQDVRKRLVICEVHRGKVFEMIVDDSFQRPPDVIASAKRKFRNQSIAETARKRPKITISSS